MSLGLAACGGTAPSQSAPTVAGSPVAAASAAPPTQVGPTATRLAAPSPAASPTAAPAPLQRLRVGNTGGSGANLRKDPDAQSERLELVPEGALVDLVDPGRDISGTTWREIRSESGTTGWIAAEFLQPVTAVEIRVSPLPISSGGPPAPAGAAGARVPPLDAQNCPETHPVKAVGVGGLRYVAPGHPQYASTAPDICFSTVEAAESLGFRAP